MSKPSVVLPQLNGSHDGHEMSLKYLEFITRDVTQDRAMEIRYFPPRGISAPHRSSVLFTSQGDLARYADVIAPPPYGTYYSLNLGTARSASACLRDSDIPHVRALAVDYDFKVFNHDGRVALAHLRKVVPVELWPTGLVHSGGGYHLIWWLRKPVPRSGAIRDLMRAVSRAVHPAGESFDDISNASRVLRLPLSTNTKPSLDAPLCHVVDFDAGRTFTTDCFQWWIEAIHLPTGAQDSQDSKGEPPIGKNSRIVAAIEEFAPGAHQTNTCSVARGLAHYGVPQPVTQAIIAKLGGLDNATDVPALERAVADMYAEEAMDESSDDEDDDNGGKANTNKTAQLLALVKMEDIMLFHDQYEEPYVQIKGAPTKTLKLKSRAFRRYLSHLSWTKMGGIASQDPFSAVTLALEGEALFHAKRIELAVRVAWHDGLLYYDLGDGRAVQISPVGWSLTSDVPILFRNPSHQKPQVEPARGGDLRVLLRYVNLPPDEMESGYGLLLLVWIVAAMIPGFPHAVLVAHGPQGSAKSSLFRMLKELIDPSIIQTLAPASNLQELVLQMSNHWLVPLDNLSAVPDWMSDALSRAVTGDGISKRELYSDADEVVFTYRRVICLNGINMVAQKPDLLDRSILLPLERLPDRRRCSEANLWQRFNQHKPQLLGAIFDTVVKALNIYPDVKLTALPRMADYAQWGAAIAEALGYQQEDFLAAYEHSIAAQNREALDASTVAQAIIELMKGRDLWSGTPSELLQALNGVAESLQIDTKSRAWPKDPSWLWRRMVVVQANLEAVGLRLEKGEKDKRHITIRRRDSAGDAEVVRGRSTAPHQPQHFPESKGML